MATKNRKLIVYAFTDNVDADEIRPDIESNPQAFLTEKLTGSRYQFGVDNIIRTGVYREMGYAYDLRPFLTKYLYSQYGSWTPIYALNKTNVRHLTYGRVAQIIEVPTQPRGKNASPIYQLN